MVSLKPSVEDALAVPRAPDWAVDWETLHDRYEWIRAMQGCPQDPVFHAEGDVWIHTRMVCEAMAALPMFRDADPQTRSVLFAAALLHDVAKPRCTVEDGDRIRSPGHSPAGALDARAILWRLGMPRPQREQVCALIRFHQVPYHWASRKDSQRLIIRLSQTARLRHLAWLAEADLRGRVCKDQPAQLESVAMFAEYVGEVGCLDGPWPFANDHARVMFFRRPDRDPHWAAYDDTDTEFTVTVMCGLPGAGKSTWIAEHAGGQPVIELDAIRRELRVSPGGPQGKVIDLARRRARERLRERESFVWDATSLTRSLRAKVVNLALDYHARVRIVHVEAPPEQLFERNRSRRDVVPRNVLDRMIKRWELPDPTEGHELTFVDGSLGSA